MNRLIFTLVFVMRTITAISVIIKIIFNVQYRCDRAFLDRPLDEAQPPTSRSLFLGLGRRVEVVEDVGVVGPLDPLAVSGEPPLTWAWGNPGAVEEPPPRSTFFPVHRLGAHTLYSFHYRGPSSPPHPDRNLQRNIQLLCGG